MKRKLARLVSRLLVAAVFVAGLLFLHKHALSSKVTERLQPNLEVALEQPVMRSPNIMPSSTTLKNPSPRWRANNFTFDESDMVDEHGNPYTIVIWKNINGKPGYLANPSECLGNVSCDVTYDKSNMDKIHAVVFPFDGLSTTGLPATRHPWQLYAWWSLESPLHSGGGGVASWKNYFNLTFHYRTDADVYAPYGSINLILRELAKTGEVELDDLLARKRDSDKMAAWAVSNCYSPRMNFAKSLMDAGLKVDTFGGCFGGKELAGGRYSPKFYEALGKYKFYFSFENSIGCKDYFTEKFWFNGLRSGAVPIVWGPRKEDVLKVAPTKSFIHSSDFESPAKLVEHLNYLASNETAYAEYLHWRTWVKHPERIETRLRMENRENDLRSFCKLCSLVQLSGRARKMGREPTRKLVSSISEAWQGAENGHCHN